MDLLENINNTLQNGADVNISLDTTSLMYLAVALFLSLFLAIVAAKLIVK